MMPSTLTTLPTEILQHVCKYLSSHSDVSNCRLTCRLLGDVGLDCIAPKVSFIILPESLARLKEISSHPVLRHHVYTVVCFTDVLPRYDTYEDWKWYARRPGLQLDWPIEPDDALAVEADVAAYRRHQIPDDELQEGWKHYQSVFAGQEKAFEALEHSLDLKYAFRNLTNLKNLHIAECELKDQVGSEQMFRGIFDKCLVRPFPSPLYPHEGLDNIGLPGVKPLISFLDAALSEKRKITSLAVDTLDVGFLDSKKTNLDTISKSLQGLRNIKLGFCSLDDQNDDTPWDDSVRTLATSRLKDFLAFAPNAETIELKFDNQLYLPYLANSANILPTKLVWPRVRILKLSGVTIHPSSFLNFLESHRQTLRSLDLSDCGIIATTSNSHPNAQSQDPADSQVLWSDVFIPIATTLSLTTLSLSDRFTVASNTPDPFAPHLQMSDWVQYTNLSVAQALEVVACSKEYDTLTNRRMAENIDSAKTRIIKELVDHPPTRSDPPRDVAIPVSEGIYLQIFLGLQAKGVRDKPQDKTRLPSLSEEGETEAVM